MTGTINMSGVPANADILAAFLYLGIDLRGRVADRRGSIPRCPRSGDKKQPRVLTPDTPCWTTGSNLQMAMFRADVLPFLPVQKDAAGNKTGKRLVNDADLQANNFPLHTVRLPQGNGNLAPESAGASLVVVYRDPTQPLRKIVLYDGIYIQPIGGTMTQHLRGFYKSSPTSSAKMTHIVGSGAKNQTETLSVQWATAQHQPVPRGRCLFGSRVVHSNRQRQPIHVPEQPRRRSVQANLQRRALLMRTTVRMNACHGRASSSVPR